MIHLDWKESIGIAATLFVFLGFTRTRASHIRIINSVGSILFIIYGVLIGSFSVWFLNGACLILNIYKLIKEAITPPPEIHRVYRASEDTPDIAEIYTRNSKK